MIEVEIIARIQQHFQHSFSVEHVYDSALLLIKFHLLNRDKKRKYMICLKCI